MRPAHRRFDPGLIDQLLESPQRFEFFQAVRVLERHFGRRMDDRDQRATELSDRIRFRNSVTLGFAPSQIESIGAHFEPADASDANGHAGRDAEKTAARKSLAYVRITPAFIGMLGSHGTLPTHYTERVVDRERYHRDRAARAFFDLFSNRAVGQFYRAWKKYRLPVQYETDRRNRFLPLVLSLSGLGFGSLRDRLREGPGSIDDESIAHFAGLLRQRPLSATALQDMLKRYFRVPVRIEQFVGRWYTLPISQRSSLGGANTVLGKNALAGERVWQRNLRVRIHVGPLGRRAYAAFLPGGEFAAALKKLLTLATGAQFEYEIRPILRAADVKPVALADEGGARLGFDAFVITRPPSGDRSDSAFELHSIR